MDDLRTVNLVAAVMLVYSVVVVADIGALSFVVLDSVLCCCESIRSFVALKNVSVSQIQPLFLR